MVVVTTKKEGGRCYNNITTAPMISFLILSSERREQALTFFGRRTHARRKGRKLERAKGEESSPALTVPCLSDFTSLLPRDEKFSSNSLSLRQPATLIRTPCTVAALLGDTPSGWLRCRFSNLFAVFGWLRGFLPLRFRHGSCL